MKTYDKFKKLDINCSAIGFIQSEPFFEYFCTPKGAKIIGSAGVDGIHYCFIKGFGETVFAVSPANLPCDYVHPLARSFEDFLRLVLSCGDFAAVEQAHFFNKEQFNAFINENQPNSEQTELLNTLSNKLSLTPMEQPFEYIKELQQSFDYSKIKYSAEYYENVVAEPADEISEWKVYYDGGFWTKSHRSRAGNEIYINKCFEWDNKTLYVPAVYACGKGMVVDICVKVNPLLVKAYIDKWMPLHQYEYKMSDEQREQAERENPLNFDFIAKLEVNGKELSQQHGSSTSWIPEACLPDGTENREEEKMLLEHYGMDSGFSWSIHRISFPWKTKRKPNICSIKLNLEQMPVSVDGLHFKNPALGDTINIVHPISGENHTLTVCEYEQKTLDFNRTELSDYDFPKYNTVMTYTLSPDLPDRKFRVCDCVRNDSPKYIGVQCTDGNSSSIAVIGGADGPTALFFSHGKEKNFHIACSALHFEPTDDIEWKTVFSEKLTDDMQIDLI